MLFSSWKRVSSSSSVVMGSSVPNSFCSNVATRYASNSCLGPGFVFCSFMVRKIRIPRRQNKANAVVPEPEF